MKNWRCWACEFEGASPLCLTAMDAFDADNLARLFIEGMRSVGEDENPQASDDEEWMSDQEMQATDCIDEMIGHNPKASLEFLYAALSRCQSSLDIAVLAAGPLENLLEAHGPEVIGDLEVKAAKSEKVRYFLSGTWAKDRIASDVWSRLVDAVSLGPVMSVDDPRDPGFGLDDSLLANDRSLAMLLNEDISVLH